MDSQIDSTVYTKAPPPSQLSMFSDNGTMSIHMRFSNNDPLYSTDEEISNGMCVRLVNYACKELIENGLNQCLSWGVNVSTLDGDCKPSDRSYCVNFKNDKGLEISLVGILTKSGWPTLDHGFEINRNQ